VNSGCLLFTKYRKLHQNGMIGLQKVISKHHYGSRSGAGARLCSTDLAVAPDWTTNSVASSAAAADTQLMRMCLHDGDHRHKMMTQAVNFAAFLYFRADASANLRCWLFIFLFLYIFLSFLPRCIECIELRLSMAAISSVLFPHSPSPPVTPPQFSSFRPASEIRNI